MSQKTIERIYTDSWEGYLRQSKKGYPSATNPFGSAIAECVGTQLNVVDIGCGTGKCVLPVAAKGNTVIGVDVSPEPLSVLRELGFTGIQLNIETDSVEPLLAHGSFDVVIMTDVLEHLFDPIDVLRQKVYPILKPKGRCIATVPNFVYLSYRLEFLMGKVSHFNNNADFTAHEIPRPYNLGHKTMFNKQNLHETFTLSGFSNVAVTPELFSESFGRFWRLPGLRQLRTKLKTLWPTLLAARFLVIAEKP